MLLAQHTLDLLHLVNEDQRSAPLSNAGCLTSQLEARAFTAYATYEKWIV